MIIDDAVKDLLNQCIAWPHAKRMECVEFQKRVIPVIKRLLIDYYCTTDDEAREIATRIWRKLGGNNV